MLKARVGESGDRLVRAEDSVTQKVSEVRKEKGRISGR